MCAYTTHVHSCTYTLIHVHPHMYTHTKIDAKTPILKMIPLSLQVSLLSLVWTSCTRQIPGPQWHRQRPASDFSLWTRPASHSSKKKAPPAGLLCKLLLTMPVGNVSVPDLKELRCSLTKPPPLGKKTPFSIKDSCAWDDLVCPVSRHP